MTLPIRITVATATTIAMIGSAIVRNHAMKSAIVLSISGCTEVPRSPDLELHQPVTSRSHRGRLGDLAEGEAFGIEVGHTALTRVRLANSPLTNELVGAVSFSATVAWIAAAIFAIRAALAAGLRSSVAPVSSANIFSAASTASAARGDGGLHCAALFQRKVAYSVLRVVRL